MHKMASVLNLKFLGALLRGFLFNSFWERSHSVFHEIGVVKRKPAKPSSTAIGGLVPCGAALGVFGFKKFYSLVLFFISLAPCILLAQNSTLISSAEITFSFESKDVQGSIGDFTSDISLDFDNIENASFKGSVAVSSLKTGNFLRDWSLKGKKYFNADNYPKITFESTSVSGTRETFKVGGILTIKDISKPITIDFVKEGNTLLGTTTLFSSDFKIDIKKERNDNKVVVSLKFVLKESG